VHIELGNIDEKTRAKILTHYNSVICNDYTTPSSVLSPNNEPPSTICELQSDKSPNVN